MAYCRTCGNQIHDQAVVCPFCGCQTDRARMMQIQQNNDSGSAGWGVLGFFFPLAGLVLYLVWNSSKPKCAKSAGIGALISFILKVIGTIITFILTFVLAGFSMGFENSFIC